MRFCNGVVAVTACLWLAATGILFGQGTTATSLGAVTHMSAAALPEAAVEIRNTGTGAAQSVTSDSQGRFRIADLAVGDYDGQAATTGFATLVHKGVVLTVGAQVVVDFALPVGQQQQTVTVEGQVSQVQTTNAAVAALI